MLSPYGCDWTQTPNFKRLADRCVTFDKCYVGSLPVCPHGGKFNMDVTISLHRSWGPMEPYDDSMPEILKKNGIYSQSDQRPLSLLGGMEAAPIITDTAAGKMCAVRRGITGRPA